MRPYHSIVDTGGMHACMHVCTYVRMYVRMYVSAPGLISNELSSVKRHIDAAALNAEAQITTQSQGRDKVAMHYNKQP